MRNLDTSAVTSSNGLPVKSGTFVHLQASYKEAIDMVTRAMVTSYLPNTVYKLFGCVNTGTSTDYVISSGAVFYNGEVYLVDASSFSVAGGNTAIASLAAISYFTDPTADPVTFTDGVARNIHQIKKVALAGGVSNTGISDYINFKRPNKGKSPKGSCIPYFPAGGTLSNFTSGLGTVGDVIGWAICDGNNGTQNLKGMFIAGQDPAQAEFNTIGGTGGEKAHLLTIAEMPAHTHAMNQADSVTGGTIPNTIGRGGVTSPNGINTGSAGGGGAHNNLPPYFVMVYITEID